MLFRDERKIEKQLDKYRLLFNDCTNSFKNAIDSYFKSKNSVEFGLCTERTHSIESDMDNLKRDISYDLYSKTLLPESRGDILTMLSKADKIPTAMENILFDLQCESISFPKDIEKDLSSLFIYTYDVLDTVISELKSVFNDKDSVMTLARKIDEDESYCDVLQRSILKTVFSLDIGFGEKVLLKLFIESLGRISDYAEDLSDSLVIISVKGQI